MIAHAGGIGNHRANTNSLEALENSVGCGYRAIEVDLSWTTDGYLVLIHDWETALRELFHQEPGAMTLEEFRSLQSPHGLTQLDLDGLARWLERHPDHLIITDIKARNVEGLKIIAERYPRLRDQIVPQIYQPETAAAVRSLGFDRLILTLYRSEIQDRRVVEFATENPVWAVTMPVGRAADSDLAGQLEAQGVVVYAHTVNDHSLAVTLREKGVFGVYSDWFTVDDENASRPLPRWTSSVKGESELDHRIVPFLPFRMEGLDTIIKVRGSSIGDSAARLDFRNSRGTVLFSKDVPSSGGEIRVADLSSLPAGRETSGWLEVFAGESVVVDLDWNFRGTSGGHWTVAGSSVTEFDIAGPGSGVRGVLLAVVNPDDVSHEYRLIRRIGVDVIDDEFVELPPKTRVLRIYRSRTDENISVSIRGGPMVAGVVRWDPMSRFVG